MIKEVTALWRKPVIRSGIFGGFLCAPCVSVQFCYELVNRFSSAWLCVYIFSSSAWDEDKLCPSEAHSPSTWSKSSAYARNARSLVSARNITCRVPYQKRVQSRTDRRMIAYTHRRVMSVLKKRKFTKIDDQSEWARQISRCVIASDWSNLTAHLGLLKAGMSKSSLEASIHLPKI